MPANTVIQLRRGTAAQWTSANPVLANGEPGYERDTGKEKRGDGVTAWTSLAYFGTGTFAPVAGSPNYLSAITPSGDTTGATDSAAVTAALTAYGTATLRPGGTFYLNTSVQLDSYQTFSYAHAKVVWKGGNAPVVTTKSWAANSGAPEARPTVVGRNGTITGDATQGTSQHGVLLRCTSGLIEGGAVLSPGGHGQGFVCAYSNGFATGAVQIENRMIGAEAKAVAAGMPILLGESDGSRSIAATAGLTSGSPTITDSAGQFSAIDIGRVLTNANITAGTKILSVQSPTSATMTANATGTSASATVTVGGLTDSGGTAQANNMTDGFADKILADTAGTSNALPQVYAGNIGGWDIGDLHTYGLGADGTTCYTVRNVYLRGGSMASMGRWYLGHWLVAGVYWDAATKTLSLGQIKTFTDKAGAVTSAVVYVNPGGSQHPSCTVNSILADHVFSSSTVYLFFDASGSGQATITPGAVATQGTHPDKLSWAFVSGVQGSGIQRPRHRLASKTYAGSGTVTATTSGWTDVDTSNLAVSFVVPASGQVEVEVSCVATPGAGNTLALAMADTSSVIVASERFAAFGSTNPTRVGLKMVISTDSAGAALVPGTAVTWKLQQKQTFGSGTCVFNYDSGSLHHCTIDALAA